LHLRLTDHAKHRGAGSPAGKGFMHCGHKLGNRRPATAIDPMLVALSAAAGCVAGEDLVAIIDSLLRSRRVDRDGICAALAQHPAHVRRLVDFVDARAESGTESLVRYRLDRLRIKNRPQVRIRGVGQVDLLIGRRLVIEVDSREYHTSEDAYESDRRRDRRLAVRGYLVIRVTYRQVMFEWAEVETDILTLIRRREHLRQRSAPV
jgi:very-short-patch-repair endonuclease